MSTMHGSFNSNEHSKVQNQILVLPNSFPIALFFCQSLMKKTNRGSKRKPTSQQSSKF